MSFAMPISGGYYAAAVAQSHQNKVFGAILSALEKTLNFFGIKCRRELVGEAILRLFVLENEIAGLSGNEDTSDALFEMVEDFKSNMQKDKNIRLSHIKNKMTL